MVDIQPIKENSNSMMETTAAVVELQMLKAKSHKQQELKDSDNGTFQSITSYQTERGTLTTLKH